MLYNKENIFLEIVAKGTITDDEAIEIAGGEIVNEIKNIMGEKAFMDKFNITHLVDIAQDDGDGLVKIEDDKSIRIFKLKDVALYLIKDYADFCEEQGIWE